MPKRSREYEESFREDMESPLEVACYLNVAIEESPQSFLNALNRVARARGIKGLAEHSGLARESLYRSLSDSGNPTLNTLVNVLRSIGMRISVNPLVPPSA